MEEYIGKNSKTEYAKTRINVAIMNIIYILTLMAGLLVGLTFTIIAIVDYYKGSDSKIFFVAFMFVLAVFILFFVGLLTVVFTTNAGIIIKYRGIIKYYKTNKLINVTKMMIPYDYKLWLVAPKDTFHAMSIDFMVDGEKKSNKTSIIFTNSVTYYGFPKFRMPDVLVSKNYVKNWALVGYDEKNKEVVVINYQKGE